MSNWETAMSKKEHEKRMRYLTNCALSEQKEGESFLVTFTRVYLRWLSELRNKAVEDAKNDCGPFGPQHKQKELPR